MFRKSLRLLFSLACFLVLLSAGMRLEAQEQLVDEGFKPAVSNPAYPEDGPTVAIDEAHFNFHTAGGQYRPFAELLRRDGYNVTILSAGLEPGALAGMDVLIIANALPRDEDNPSLPAFTEQECDILVEWVRSGGSLLLIADHAPFGDAAVNLAGRFGVAMGKGWAFDRGSDGGITSQLVFSRENGLLGNHPILSGREEREEISVIKTFTGQSIGVPDGAAALMLLGASAREAKTREDMQAEGAAASGGEETGSFGVLSIPVAGRAQGLAMKYGKGRIVVLGEAGFLSAQVIRFPDGREIKFGMNVPGNDNIQFGLNVLHWLSGLLN